MKCSKDLEGGAYPAGTICSFSCSEGASLHGDDNTTCTSRGSWSHDPVTCQGTFTFLYSHYQK